MPRAKRRIDHRVSLTIPDKMARRCPKCEAAPGHRCGRQTGSIGWVTVKNLHKER